MFFRTSVDVCLWNVKIILTHTILDIKVKLTLQKRHDKIFWRMYVINKIFNCYLVNKEQKLMFLVVFWSNVDFGFARQFFCQPDQVHR